MAKVNFTEVAKHDKADDCWMVIKGKVYDLSKFKDEHPGGSAYVTDCAGKEATEAFSEIHPEDVIKRTITGDDMKFAFKGEIDASTVPADAKAKSSQGHGGEEEVEVVGKPPVEAMINVFDFEAIAQREMLGSGKKEGWAYYSSGGDDEITLRENHNAFHRLWFKPRVMVNVKEIDMRTKILGKPVSFPVYLSAVAMCGLGHDDGEVAWTKAAGRENVNFMIPSLASRSLEEITGCRIEGQTLYFQLYVNPNRDVAKQMVEDAEASGCSALFITCDAPQLGNREKDRRNKATKAAAVQKGGQSQTNKSEGVSKALTSFIDPSLCWEDIKWFKSITKMSIILKGIQTAEDAILAAEHGCAGIVLSNHGGRQLDCARSGIEVLPDVVAALKKKGFDKKMEIFVDGGIRRGTDIFKAVALGATAVGLGRPALYAMSAYGEDGIAKMLQLLKSEFQMTMRLCGAPTIADIKPEMVITDNLKDHIAAVPTDSLQQSVYLPHVTAKHGGDAPAATSDGAGGGAGGGGASAKDDASASFLEAAGATLGAVIMAIVKTVFVPNMGQALNRTAVFMIAFLVIHMVGNLTIFASDDAFNTYGHMLNVNPALKFIEFYLLAATVIHAVVATYLTWRYGKWKTMATNKLFLSSIAITAFIVMHLLHFKFGKEYTTKAAIDGPLKGAEIRDLARLEDEIFSDKKQVVWYVLAVVAIGIHLYYGWTKTARKMGLAKKYLPGAVLLGHALIWPLTVGFLSTPIYVYMRTRGKVAGQTEL